VEKTEQGKDRMEDQRKDGLKMLRKTSRRWEEEDGEN
jgi:hypothetical protein